MSKKLREVENPFSDRRPGLSERLETLRLLNAGKPRSRREYTTNIQHIVSALLAAGYASLDAQATALGIHRATAWTMIRKKHKLDRLNTNTINCMLANPELPLCVRAVIEQYVAERPVLGRRQKTHPVDAGENKGNRIYKGGTLCERPEKPAARKQGKLQSSQKSANHW